MWMAQQPLLDKAPKARASPCAITLTPSWRCTPSRWQAGRQRLRSPNSFLGRLQAATWITPPSSCTIGRPPTSGTIPASAYMWGGGVWNGFWNATCRSPRTRPICSAARICGAIGGVLSFAPAPGIAHEDDFWFDARGRGPVGGRGLARVLVELSGTSPAFCFKLWMPPQPFRPPARPSRPGSPRLAALQTKVAPTPYHRRGTATVSAAASRGGARLHACTL